MACAHATVRLAHVNRADAHRHTERRCLVHNELTDLLYQLFLYLQSATEIVHDPVVFGQADNLAGRGRKPDGGTGADRLSPRAVNLLRRCALYRS